MSSYFRGISLQKTVGDLKDKIAENDVINGAAAIAFFLTMAVFPGMVFLLSLLPYLPIEHLREAVFHILNQALPGGDSQIFKIVEKTTSQRNGGLLASSLVFAIWSASSGLYATMEQLNTTYDVKEGRSFLKARGIALLLTLIFFVLVIGTFLLIVLGGVIQHWPGSLITQSETFLIFFAVLRWAIIFLVLLLSLACIYYFGPDVEQKFFFVSPGSVVGVIIIACISVLFRLYVINFGTFNATYGSIGVIVLLMMWLYMTCLIILLGSEMNVLIESYISSGKYKRKKRSGRTRSRRGRHNV